MLAHKDVNAQNGKSLFFSTGTGRPTTTPSCSPLERGLSLLFNSNGRVKIFTAPTVIARYVTATVEST